MSWKHDAACVGVDPDLFFGATEAEAKAVCAGCPVKVDCLIYAVENDILHGVWGGRTPAERKDDRLARRNIVKLFKRPGPPPGKALKTRRDRDRLEARKKLAWGEPT